MNSEDEDWFLKCDNCKEHLKRYPTDGCKVHRSHGFMYYYQTTNNKNYHEICVPSYAMSKLMVKILKNPNLDYSQCK